ncbi:MAG: DNA-3-methyladenine glycosylase I [Myxococcales bacterium]|nr:DNA-3-methyladenine glycosylase I [Myxococcales bacterium]
MTSATPGLAVGDDEVIRCWWAGDDLEYRRYHDHEWGQPVADDRRLFEKICLEGFQAGLSWLTILRKRPRLREVFHDFDLERVAAMGEADVLRLLDDRGIIRHRGKIEATINNARRALELRAEEGSLAAFFWRFEPPATERPARLDHDALRSLGQTPTSKALSKALKRRGWRFVGPTTCYAFMQAMGIVNDHLEGCPARARVLAARAGFAVPKSASHSHP